MVYFFIKNIYSTVASNAQIYIYIFIHIYISPKYWLDSNFSEQILFVRFYFQSSLWIWYISCSYRQIFLTYMHFQICFFLIKLCCFAYSITDYRRRCYLLDKYLFPPYTHWNGFQFLTYRTEYNGTKIVHIFLTNQSCRWFRISCF